MEEEATTIHDLLPEVLIKIFKKLEKGTELRNVQQVCYRWSELVDKKVGRKVCVGLISCRSLIPVEQKQLRQIGIQTCFLYEPDPSEEENEKEWKNVLEGGLKYPYLLKDLYLRGCIYPDIFVKLVKTARNLAFLELTLFSLSKLRNEDLKNLALPKLKELKVRGNGFESEKLDEVYDGRFLPNLTTLLRENHFPRLTILSLHLAPSSFLNLATIRNAICFVQNHNTLQDLHMHLDMTTDSFDASVTPEPISPTELKTPIDGIRRRGDFHLRNLSFHIENLDLPHARGFPLLPQAEIFNEFLLKIESLDSAEMTIEPIPQSTLQAICSRNAATLRVLDIYSEHTELDCSLMASLQVVQEIRLVSAYYGAIGINQLPLTLTKIYVWAPIQRNEAEHILFDLPNIKDIELRWEKMVYCARDGPCVTLDMLRQFNQNRRVDRLRVSNQCLIDGKSFPPEGISNNDPTNPEMLEVLVADKSSLDWKLNETGFYTNGRK